MPRDMADVRRQQEAGEVAAPDTGAELYPEDIAPPPSPPPAPPPPPVQGSRVDQDG